MSIREEIAENIVDTLKAYKMRPTSKVKLGMITREPINLEEVSRESFPVIFVESSSEEREDGTMGAANITRFASIEYILDVYLHGNQNRDNRRNTLIDLIETALDEDRTRGEHADDTELLEVEVINLDDSAPYALARLTFRVRYCYKRGNS